MVGKLEATLSRGSSSPLLDMINVRRLANVRRVCRPQTTQRAYAAMTLEEAKANGTTKISASHK
jgi:hypothetical protein